VLLPLLIAVLVLYNERDNLLGRRTANHWLTAIRIVTVLVLLVIEVGFTLAGGRFVFAGFAAGGWGNLVIVAHADGVKTMYAHLATVTVHRTDLLAVGSRLGTVGATGHASGPHLHFEVRFRGAAVDPRSALP